MQHPKIVGVIMESTGESYRARAHGARTSRARCKYLSFPAPPRCIYSMIIFHICPHVPALLAVFKSWACKLCFPFFLGHVVTALSRFWSPQGFFLHSFRCPEGIFSTYFRLPCAVLLVPRRALSGVSLGFWGIWAGKRWSCPKGCARRARCGGTPYGGSDSVS